MKACTCCQDCDEYRLFCAAHVLNSLRLVYNSMKEQADIKMEKQAYKVGLNWQRHDRLSKKGALIEMAIPCSNIFVPT